MGKRTYLVMALIVLFLFTSCPALAQSGYVCGDANGDGQLNVGDAVFMISYIFKGGPAPDTGCCEGCAEGATRLCYTGPPGTQGVGQCAAGIQTCIGGEWGPCEGEILPSFEVCDGYDNDCDGIIDNGFDVGEPCSAGQGECEECGVMVCRQDGTGTECSAVGGVPTAEVCDGLDNDCDGIIDNGFDVREPCSAGLGECAECGVMVCKQDGTGTECSATGGTPQAELCDGLDNDCDGEIDEGYDVGEPCSVGQGECEALGVMICRGDGSGTECSAVPGSPSPELCDGLDNDCDGEIDEGFNVGEPCSAGIGECEEWGVMVCTQDGSGTECSAIAGVPTPEVCDGLDNDCDGTVDEGDPDGGGPCGTGIPGVCAAGTLHCQDGALVCIQNVQPSPEVCDGLDNDCDGMVDDGNPDGGGPCSTGLPGVCASGTLQCQGGALVCIQDVQPSPEVCDGLDNDCDGTVDEGNPDGGGPCNTGMPGVCAAGTLQCQSGALVCVQTVMPSTEVCDGLDNDCDGMVDEGDPGGGGPCNTGLPGVCAAGTLHCQGGALVCVQDVMPSAEICNDNLDNDCDGLTDGADPDCP